MGCATGAFAAIFRFYLMERDPELETVSRRSHPSGICLVVFIPLAASVLQIVANLEFTNRALLEQCKAILMPLAEITNYMP